MAIALVSHTVKNSNTGGGSGSLTTTAIDTTGASLIVVSCNTFGGNQTLTDSASNTWAVLPKLTGGSSCTLQVFYCFAPTTSASHTFTYPGANGTAPSICVAAFSGTATDLPLDIILSDAGTTSGTTHAAAQLQPSVDNGLLLAILSLENSFYSSVDSSFTLTDSAGVAGNAVSGALTYQIQTTATNRTPTFTVTTGNTQYAIYNLSISAPISTKPALLSHTSAASTNSNDVTTSAIDTRGASVIVIEVSLSGNSSATITDSSSNTWTATTVHTNGATNTIFYYCNNPSTSATHTFTATKSGAKPAIAVVTFSGTNGYDIDTGSATNTVNLTPTNSIELLVSGIAVASSSATLLPDSGFTALEDVRSSANSMACAIAYKIQASHVSTSTTWNSPNADRTTAIVAFIRDSSTALTVTQSDSLSFSDALSLLAPGLQALSDSFSFSDVLSLNIPIVDLILSDSLTFSDALQTQIGLILSEGFTLSDFLSFGASLPLAISGDQFNFSDFVVFLIGIGIGQSDSLSISDVLKVAAGTAQILGDNILLSDFLATLVQTFPAYSDSFALSDTARLILSLELKPNDSLSLSDAVQLAVLHELVLSNSDSLNLSDSVELSLGGDLDSYIRHYLNDVPKYQG